MKPAGCEEASKAVSRRAGEGLDSRPERTFACVPAREGEGKRRCPRQAARTAYFPFFFSQSRMKAISFSWAEMTSVASFLISGSLP